jgi:hypothetical protein
MILIITWIWSILSEIIIDAFNDYFKPKLLDNHNIIVVKGLNNPLLTSQTTMFNDDVVFCPKLNNFDSLERRAFDLFYSLKCQNNVIYKNSITGVTTFSEKINNTNNIKWDNNNKLTLVGYSYGGSTINLLLRMLSLHWNGCIINGFVKTDNPISEGELIFFKDNEMKNPWIIGPSSIQEIIYVSTPFYGINTINFIHYYDKVINGIGKYLTINIINDILNLEYNLSVKNQEILTKYTKKYINDYHIRVKYHISMNDTYCNYKSQSLNNCLLHCNLQNNICEKCGSILHQCDNYTLERKLKFKH